MLLERIAMSNHVSMSRTFGIGCISIIAIGILAACSGTSTYYAATPAPKVTQDKLALEIPVFSVDEVLASADEATRRKLIGKARATFISALDEIGLQTRHLTDSQFDIRLVARVSAIYEQLDIKFGRQDISTWVLQSADTMVVDGDITVSLILITFSSPALPVIYADDTSAKRSGGLYVSGGKAAALDFIEACEILGVSINR
jgi:hypothetical protein